MTLEKLAERFWENRGRRQDINLFLPLSGWLRRSYPIHDELCFICGQFADWYLNYDSENEDDYLDYGICNWMYSIYSCHACNVSYCTMNLAKNIPHYFIRERKFMDALIPWQFKHPHRSWCLFFVPRADYIPKKTFVRDSKLRKEMWINEFEFEDIIKFIAARIIQKFWKIHKIVRELLQRRGVPRELHRTIANFLKMF